MKKIIVITSVVVMLTGFNITGAQEAPQPGKDASARVLKKQTTCPVMGGAVNTNLYVDADGKRVYFCCKGCPAEFKKESAKYISKLEKEGITLDKAPAADPTKKQTTDAEAAPAQGQDHSGHKGGGCCM